MKFISCGNIWIKLSHRNTYTSNLAMTQQDPNWYAVSLATHEVTLVKKKMPAVSDIDLIFHES